VQVPGPEDHWWEGIEERDEEDVSTNNSATVDGNTVTCNGSSSKYRALFLVVLFQVCVGVGERVVRMLA